MLKEFVGVIGLTEGWAKSVLKSLNWSKRRATTSKVELFAQLLAKEKFTFQKAITKAIQGNDKSCHKFRSDSLMLCLTRKIFISF